MYVEELGTDINSSWTFNNGDLVLVSDEDNIVQSIVNRLNCSMNSLGLYYYEYGSFIQSLLGWKKNEKTFEYMKLEVKNTLKQDPRLKDFEVDVYLDKNNKVAIDLAISFYGSSDLSMSLILNENGTLVI